MKGGNKTPKHVVKFLIDPTSLSALQALEDGPEGQTISLPSIPFASGRCAQVANLGDTRTIEGASIMAHTGKIKSYDAAKGNGMITPEKGGDALPFNKSDLQQQAQEPRSGDAYHYETREVNGGKVHATSLQMEQGTGSTSQKDQASKQQG
jgi:CspA family cold shock protein